MVSGFLGEFADFINLTGKEVLLVKVVCALKMELFHFIRKLKNAPVLP